MFARRELRIARYLFTVSEQRNMKSNRNWLAGSLLGAAAVGSAALGLSIAAAADEATPAAPAAQGPHAWHHHGEGHLLAKLNLSAEQQAAVKTIMANARPQM